MAALAGLAHAESAAAGGFGIEDHSARQLGAANAGEAAAAEDPSTIADNPAGIAFLDRPQVSATGILVDSHLPFANGGSLLPTGGPISGAGSDGGGFALLPNLFATTPVTPELSIGFGAFPSFGLATNYPQAWVGRYAALATKLTSIDLAPTVAYRPLPNLAVGLSPVARYTKIRLTNAVDFGSIGAGLGIPGAVPGGADGGADVHADAWSFGLNLGVLFEPTSDTRLGVAYFHSNTASVSGSAHFSPSPLGNAIAAASGAFIDTGAAGDVPYPDRVSLGVVHRLTPDIDLRAGFIWTQWDSFQVERVMFANPVQPPAIMNERWRNTVTVSLGGNYRLSPSWQLRAGLEYDETPVPGATNRDPRIPDSSRIEAALGAGYALNSSTTLDFAYEHFFGGSVQSLDLSAAGDQTAGSTRFSADVFGIQVTFAY